MKHITYILPLAAALSALESAGVKPDRTDTRLLPDGTKPNPALPPLAVILESARTRESGDLEIVLKVGCDVFEPAEVVDLTAPVASPALNPAAGPDEGTTTEAAPKKSKKAK